LKPDPSGLNYKHLEATAQFIIFTDSSSQREYFFKRFCCKNKTQDKDTKTFLNYRKYLFRFSLIIVYRSRGLQLWPLHDDEDMCTCHNMANSVLNVLEDLWSLCEHMKMHELRTRYNDSSDILRRSFLFSCHIVVFCIVK